MPSRKSSCIDPRDIEKLLIGAGTPLTMPFKLDGYLLGHLDGLEHEAKPLELCPDLAGSLYELLLWTAVRKLWDTRETWGYIALFDDLVRVAHTCFALAGVNLQKQVNDLCYVSVSHTAASMPNGEADMVVVGFQKQLLELFGPSY